MASSFKDLFVLDDLPMLCLNLSDTVIINFKVVDYSCIIHDISNSEEIRLLENSALDNHGYM